MAEENLRNKTLKGVGWSAAQSIVGHSVTFVIGIILARLLTPEAYGTVGIAMIVITILNVFIDAGFGAALIRKPQVSEADYNTMFVLTMTMSVLMYLILFISAPYVSSFFDNDVTTLIRALGICLVIGALPVAQATKMNKEINMKPLTYIHVSVGVVGGIVGVICAYCGMGVWALVAQNLTASILSTCMLFIVSPWKPSFEFSMTSARYMWGFGWKILVANVIGKIWYQAYSFVVGKFYSLASLGQYSRAKGYSDFLSSNITNIVERVSYPTLANIQEDEGRMISVYRRMIKLTMFLTVCSLISLGAVSEPFIRVLIGDKWLEAASYLPYLCVLSSFWPLRSMNRTMLKILGRSDLFLNLMLITKALECVPICIGIFVGIKPMILGWMVVVFVAFLLDAYFNGKRLGYTPWMQIKDVLHIYGIALCIALSVYFFKYLPLSPFIILPLQIGVGSIVFFVICELFKPYEYIELKSIAIQTIRKYTHKV